MMSKGIVTFIIKLSHSCIVQIAKAYSAEQNDVLMTNHDITNIAYD